MTCNFNWYFLELSHLLLLFTPPHIVSNLYDLIYLVKRKKWTFDEQCWGKLLLKVMHKKVLKKVTNYIT